MLVDCYARGNQSRMKKPSANEDSKPPNLFNKQQDYDYFLEIYQRWKDKQGRKQYIIQQERTSKLSVRQNESFSSISSAKSSQRIPKRNSGFFASRASSSNMNFASEGTNSPSGMERSKNKDKQGSHFGPGGQDLAVSDSSNDSSEVTFSDEGVDKISIGDAANDTMNQDDSIANAAFPLNQDLSGEISTHEEMKSESVSDAKKGSRSSKSKITHQRKKSKHIDLEALLPGEENENFGRLRSRSSNNEL